MTSAHDSREILGSDREPLLAEVTDQIPLRRARPTAYWTRSSDASWKRTGRFGTGQLPEPTAVPLTKQRLSSVVDIDGTLIGAGAANLPDGKPTVGAIWTSRDGRTWSELAAADSLLRGGGGSATGSAAHAALPAWRPVLTRVRAGLMR